MQTIGDVLAEARSRIGRLSPQEAATAQEAGAIIVDTREYRYRHAEGEIPGARSVPLSVLAWRLDDVDQPIVLVCNDGFSSSLAGEWLVRIGFRDVSDLVGGFRAWSAAGLPVINRHPSKGRAARVLAVMLVS
jgi:rhodanese-related sulfurtransferase